MNQTILTKVADNRVLSSAMPHIMKGAMKIEKRKPELLLAGGIVSGVGAAVALARAYNQHEIRLEVVNDELTNMQYIIRHNQENAGEFIEVVSGEEPIEVVELTSKEQAMLLLPLYGEKLGVLLRLYGPAILLGGASLYLVLSSHGVMKGRNKNLVIALGASTEAFRQYRERIVEEYGGDVDLRTLLGLEKREVMDISVNEETGRKSKTPREETVIGEAPSPLMYTRIFDQTHQDFDPDSKELNEYFLKCWEEFFNLEYRVKGYVMLNDVCRRMGFQTSAEGQLVGWHKDAPGDDFISFGIDADYNQNPGDPRFVFNPNVNGVVYNYL